MPLAVARSPQEWLAQFGNSGRRAALTIGNFDGVHLGHQAILRRVRESARESGALAAILTFYPHPARVLRPASAPVLLMTLEQRLTAIESLGLDAALVLTFDAPLAHMTAQDFAQRLLVRTMRAAAVCVGENFRFGHRKAGDVALLRALGRENGFAVEAVPPVEIEGLIVSSTAIRESLLEGRVADARGMLGRPFALRGTIATGTGQGRKLVVPTLNLSTEQELLPKRGVYATECILEGASYHSVTNIGVRPTFDGTRLAIESHLFAFDRALTTGELELRFHSRLRDEQKFPDPAALREQVLKDIEAAKEYFRREAVPAETPRS